MKNEKGIRKLLERRLRVKLSPGSTLIYWMDSRKRKTREWFDEYSTEERIVEDFGKAYIFQNGVDDNIKKILEFHRKITNEVIRVHVINFKLSPSCNEEKFLHQIVFWVATPLHSS